MQVSKDALKQLIRAGRGVIPASKVLEGGYLVNVMSNEVYLADVAIYEERIVAIGKVEEYKGPETEVIDVTGLYLLPGLIDGHLHSECSKLSITSFAKAVVPCGTTSIVSGLDEYISVSGLEGLQEVFKEVKKSPLKVFWGAPYKTPYTFPKSTVAFNFTEEVHQEVQQWPECFGVWETVREAVQEEDEDTLGALATAQNNRLPIFGCAPMARGKELNGYLCAGVRLDHESYDHEEVVEKMRNGMHMLIRESSVTHFLEENIRAVTEVNPYLARRVSFCTDDVTATDILEKGHMDNVVRQAIKAGVEPITAIQMATINSAEAYRIDHLVGSITPGKIADIVMVDSLEGFQVQAVLTDGKLVARDKKMSYELKAPARSSVLSCALKCATTTPEDFQYRVEIEQGTAEVLSMNVKGPFVRKRRDVTLQVANHIVQADTENDVLMVSVLERFGRNGNKSLAFCSGWKLKKGAMASSAAPDDNNIIVMGADASDMSIAVNHLIENGGGQVIVADGEILEFLALPVGGIVSDLEAEEIARQESLLTKAANSLGCDLPDPLMYMFFLPITAIPDYAITDVGPVDCIALTTFDPILALNPGK
ncbi:adenine deaminase [Desulfotalea psychrophila]|uniref:Adenine deaminase 1 n=1 Tax=Desulfotalea psychrophila (strain LSv54 / DSM 12343) TaxID=177439 RepID=ADEC1_DESPS|nr:adenine deaminase C-terminal domain-containing protein [Desulfotalea psychrophila]Q6ANH2.1 RecName: Full=Adenine deaminase 1; Short=Adenase 1; Short=Adenine aminase 1 [Desulfotalea psychrophila LSv54]CAG36102.1 related to adenine deaminase [Desulfotalea psychrophila LSv54]